MTSWYTRYRPQTIEEIDKESVRLAIESFVKSNRFPHALLFSGPKGTGKTSTARIVAKIVNCTGPAHLTGSGQSGYPRGAKTARKLGEPCNNCSHCREITQGSSMAVIELDGASNRGIEDVRALRESVKLVAPGGQTKVYIIDEAHMLTAEAANALLKTLEEPPAKVMFILATTEAQKLPDTIRSRATLIQFSPATQQELLRSVGRVVKQEGLQVDKGTLETIVHSSEGSFRDAIKVVEQLVADKKLTKEAVGEFFASRSWDPAELVKHLAAGDTPAALALIDALARGGTNMHHVTVSFVGYLHDMLLEVMAGRGPANSLTAVQLLELVRRIVMALDQMRSSPIAELPLELAIIEWSGEEKVDSHSNPTKSGAGDQAEPKTSTAKLKVKIKKVQQISNEAWQQCISAIKSHNHSIGALLRSTRPLMCDGQTLTVGVFYQFHKEKLEQELYRHVVEEVVSEVLGTAPLRVTFILEERPAEAVKKREDRPTAQSEDLAKVAEEIFANSQSN